MVLQIRRFAKGAYDAGKYFNLSYDEIIIYGVFGFVLFGAIAPISAHLADKFSRSLLMVIFHFWHWIFLYFR